MNPNFFIVGAPKCGTTALSEYLRRHPQVFMSEVKEPHFFATDFPGKRVYSDEKSYKEAFADAKPQHRAIGEASVYYLYSDEALPNIKSVYPEARIIAMLRDPVELIHSLHGQYLYSRNEDEKDLSRAWSLIDERKRMMRLPSGCRDSKLLHYDRVAMLGAQMQRLVTIFPKKQVLWIFYDDFARDPGTEYRRVVSFLGLEDDGRKEFHRVNQGKRHRLGVVGSFTQRPPKSLVKVGLWLKNVTGARRLGLLQKLRDMNAVTTPRKPMSVELRRAIAQHYRSDVLQLAELTGRSLSQWPTLALTRNETLAAAAISG